MKHVTQFKIMLVLQIIIYISLTVLALLGIITIKNAPEQPWETTLILLSWAILAIIFNIISYIASKVVDEIKDNI